MNYLNTIFKAGLGITAALIAYFLIISSFGLADHFYLSFFNAVIMIAGIYVVIKAVFRERGSNFTYMDGFTAGLATGIGAAVFFTVFMGIYLLEINPELVIELNNKLPLAEGTNDMTLLFFIFLSGVSTAVVSSLLIIPIFKPSWNIRQVRELQRPMNQHS